MGRYVRPVLRTLAALPHIALTLLVRDPRELPYYRTLVGESIVTAPPAAANAGTRFACVWYPWNGMRFASRAPAVVTLNDDFAFAYPARTAIDRWREQRPIRRGVERAARILTISRWSRAAIAKRFGLDAEKIGIIPLAPDPFFCPGEEPPSETGPFVLAVGTREARKNTPFLVDIFARAFPGGDVRLVVVGELDLALRAALNAASVPFAVRSHVDDAALRRLYRTAAAVAVPSLAEGFGLVAAEAQACGAAVVAANAAALPETVESGGILIDPRDADGWTAALREVVRNDALNTLYRTAALGRWSGAATQQTAPAVLALLQSAIDDPA